MPALVLVVILFFLLFFLPRLRCKLVRTFFFRQARQYLEIDLGTVVRRVINEFLRGSGENFNWNMLLRKSA